MSCSLVMHQAQHTRALFLLSNREQEYQCLHSEHPCLWCPTVALFLGNRVYSGLEHPTQGNSGEALSERERIEDQIIRIIFEREQSASLLSGSCLGRTGVKGKTYPCLESPTLASTEKTCLDRLLRFQPKVVIMVYIMRKGVLIISCQYYCSPDCDRVWKECTG